ncbi:MAG: DUF5723 family protein [Flavobacteriaceae bacterium]
MKIFNLIFVLLSAISFSQNKQLLYGFSEIPQSLLLNPGGQVKHDWYFGIPLLSHVHVSAGATGSTIYDVFAVDGIDFNTKLKAAVYSMNERDFYSANQQLEIFSGGFAFGDRFTKNKYLSFGMYQEFDFISYFPKDYAVLGFEGNQNNIGRYFDLSHLRVKSDVVSVFHVGFNKKVNQDFTYGVRGKIYSSLANVNSVNNQGYFVTAVGKNNYYNHIFNLDLQLRTSGIANYIDEDTEVESSQIVKDMQKRLLFGGNLGLGFDIGFTYKLKEQWTLDASLLDVGFIRHSKDVENYSVSGVYNFEGFNPIFPEAEDGQTAQEYWDEVKENMEDLFEVDTTVTKFTSWRPVKFNASINYAFEKDADPECNCATPDNGYKSAAGIQLYAINRPKQPELALTAYYYRKLFKGLRAKATYTVDSYSPYNLGLGLSAHIGGVNFYLMADNFLQYSNLYNAQSLSLQLGFNYIFNKKSP